MHQMKRALLDDDQLFQQSSAREGLYERVASVSHTPRIKRASTARFNMYGSVEAEYLMQPESVTTCVVMVYDFSSMCDQGVFATILDLRGRECRTSLELDVALANLTKGKENKFWFLVLPVKNSVYGAVYPRPSGQRLTLNVALSRLKAR